MPRHHPTLYDYTSNEQIATLYDKEYCNSPLFTFDTNYLDTVLERPASLVDLGCGTGRHVVHFARRGFSVTGVDLSQHMLDICRKKVRAEGLMVRLVQGDLMDMPFLEDGASNYVIMMFSTLGLIKGAAQRRAALGEVNRILRKAGRFVLHVHNRYHNLTTSWGRKWFFKNYLDAADPDWDVGDKLIENYRNLTDLYIHTFSRRELRKLLRDANFRVLDEVCLNERRDGRLTGPLRGLKANGFLVTAEKI